ncbi:pyridoxal phosphate-dependent transferase [Gigaspora rosea]|uniref:serine C-palmitoyltransferase n=1 Tax=Gigaspora rosea TaxID=44941 RepID=A0A397V178_9GLOM|nr:pyridoxal phosphate-dependent transferase [Gigaspora rosea]
MNTSYPILNDLFVFLNSTITDISIVYSRIPGSGILLKYIKNSHQNDPFRTFLEALLVLFAIIYLFTKRYRTDNNLIELTPSEVEELVEEWQPEPLVPTITESQRIELDKTPILNGPQGPRIKLVNCKNNSLMNFASFDFLGLTTNELIKEKAIQILRKYGVGSCGPPGFYGTIDVHTEFERTVSEFLGTDDTILYSQAFSTIGSAIPSFCKRGDIIVADQGCNFAIQKGIQISRSVIKWYKHNDMQDLENILLKIKNEDIESGRRLTRRFIVTEGIFENSGDIAQLPKLLELKKKFKYRLILDESLSIGTLGKRGAGLTDYFNINPKEVDMIVGSMCTALCSSGGFCSGSFEITDHQRISGPAYCYSAALPAMLSACATESIRNLERNPHLVAKVLSNTSTFKSNMTNVKYVTVDGFADSPVFHLRLNKDIKTNSIEEKEKLLQEIVDDAMNNGVILTRAKYVYAQEMFGIEPSIRICISANFSKKEIEKAAAITRSAITKVLKNKIR